MALLGEEETYVRIQVIGARDVVKVGCGRRMNGIPAPRMDGFERKTGAAR